MSNDFPGTPEPYRYQPANYHSANYQPEQYNPAGTPTPQPDPADPDADMPEIGDHDPLVRPPAAGADSENPATSELRPIPMPTTGGGAIQPTPMPTTGHQVPPVPMPYQRPGGTQTGGQDGYTEASYRPSTDYRQLNNGSYPGQQSSPWPNSAWSAPQTPFPAHATVSEAPPVRPPGRGRRTAAAIGATVVLALAAGFGAGLYGGRLAGNDSTATVAAPVDHSLTQQTPSETASAQGATGSIESVAAAVLPSVVSVVSTSSSSEGEGSGVILTQDGYILTNNHVISGATDLTVRFNDGTTASATVVGADVTGDLAVIKVDGVTGLTPATLGTSGDIAVGEQVIAIGSPLGLSATVTSGIVSALNRPVRTTSETPTDPRTGQSTAASGGTVLNAIQTDAAINPGNSGGPLVNMQGQIIGINSAIASLSSSSTSQSGSIGVGFAIPIDSAARIAQEIMKTGKSSHAVLGASVGDASNGNSVISTGAEIKQVTSGGAAEAAGLQVGDVITKIDGNLIESSDALVATIRSAAPGSQVQVTLLRGTSTQTVAVTLGSATS